MFCLILCCVIFSSITDLWQKWIIFSWCRANWLKFRSLSHESAIECESIGCRTYILNYSYMIHTVLSDCFAIMVVSPFCVKKSREWCHGNNKLEMEERILMIFFIECQFARTDNKCMFCQTWLQWYDKVTVYACCFLNLMF